MRDGNEEFVCNDCIKHVDVETLNVKSSQGINCIEYSEVRTEPFEGNATVVERTNSNTPVPAITFESNNVESEKDVEEQSNNSTSTNIPIGEPFMKTLESLDNEISMLRETIIVLKDEISDKNSRISEAEKEVENITEMNRKLTEDLGKVKEDNKRLENVANDIVRLKEQNSKLKDVRGRENEKEGIKV